MSVINSYVPSALFLYPLKTSEPHAFLMFSEDREWVGVNGLKDDHEYMQCNQLD